MDDIIIVLESMTPEQYTSFFSSYPIPPFSINHNKPGYIEMMSKQNDNLKQFLITLLNNRVNIIHSDITENKVSIQLIINSQDFPFIKYIKENSDNTYFKFIPLGNSNYIVEIIINDNQTISIINQLVLTYFKKNTLSTKDITQDIHDYIIKAYSSAKKEHLDNLLNDNRTTIINLKEKHRQENSQLFDSANTNISKDIMQNEVPIREIYDLDPEYQQIPYEELTEDMKYTMCNKYFKTIVEQRLRALRNKLIDLYNVDFDMFFHKQRQINLPNYGISGNLYPQEDGKTSRMFISMHSCVNFCTIDGDIACINEDLLGQIIITILHEHEHILQEKNTVDPNLLNAIRIFEYLSSQKEVDNYRDHPAEIEANLASFIQFRTLAKLYNINNPNEIIIKRAETFSKYAEQSHNFYKNQDISTIENIIQLLKERLQNVINKLNAEFIIEEGKIKKR